MASLSMDSELKRYTKTKVDGNKCANILELNVTMLQMNAKCKKTPLGAVKHDNTKEYCGERLSETAVNTENADSKSTDQQLVERVQRGDKKAFDLLVLKYQGKVASLVSRYVGDKHEVLDVVQESFIKAYRALKNFRGESAFYTWLYRISINTAKNYLVAKGRRPPSADIDVEDAEHFTGESGLKNNQSPEKLLYKSELEQALNNAIRLLPEDLRVALTLREFDGLSYDEIAEVMDCPVGTVRSRIFRARDAVDKKIAPYIDGYQGP